MAKSVSSTPAVAGSTPASAGPLVTKATFVADAYAKVRNAAAAAEGKAGRSIKDYAGALCARWVGDFWKKDSPHFKAWQGEKALYIAALEKRSHSNVPQAITRLVKTAAVIRHPELAKQKKGPRDTLALSKRQQTELEILWKAGYRLSRPEAIGLDDVEKQVQSAIGLILEDILGVDLSALTGDK